MDNVRLENENTSEAELLIICGGCREVEGHFKHEWCRGERIRKEIWEELFVFSKNIRR